MISIDILISICTASAKFKEKIREKFMYNTNILIYDEEMLWIFFESPFQIACYNKIYSSVLTQLDVQYTVQSGYM